VSPGPGADVAAVSPGPGADVAAVSPGPGADVAAVSPGPGADVAAATVRSALHTRYPAGLPCHSCSMRRHHVGASVHPDACLRFDATECPESCPEYLVPPHLSRHRTFRAASGCGSPAGLCAELCCPGACVISPVRAPAPQPPSVLSVHPPSADAKPRRRR
jgi:hypothetical protein